MNCSPFGGVLPEVEPLGGDLVPRLDLQLDDLGGVLYNKEVGGALREEREVASKSWEGFRAGERVLPAAGWGEVMGRKRSTPKVPTLVPTGPA